MHSPLSKAFLIGYLDLRTGEFAGAAFSSESTPTQSFDFLTFVLLCAKGVDYEDSLRNLKILLNDPYYAKLKKIIKLREGETLDVAKPLAETCESYVSKRRIPKAPFDW